MWSTPSGETPPNRLRGGEGPVDTGDRWPEQNPSQELAKNGLAAIAKMKDRAYKAAKSANKQFGIKSIFPNGIKEAFGTMAAM